jgi:hypothetical protein
VLRLTFALTYASIEGMTIPGILRLHDGDHPRFDWRKLFVGLSRGTAANDVEVVYPPPPPRRYYQLSVWGSTG